MWPSDPRIRLLVPALAIFLGFTPQAGFSEQPRYEFFSGEVVELSTERLVVERKVRGKQQQRHSFIMTSESKIEGKLCEKARVTVGFKTIEQGDVAVHVIVRVRPAGPRTH